MENPSFDTKEAKQDLGEIENGVSAQENGGASPSKNGMHSGKVSPTGLPTYNDVTPGNKPPPPERVLSVSPEVEERRRAEREKEPFIFIRWIVNRPKTWFCEYKLK